MTLIINRLQQVSSKVIGRDTTYITTSEANMILIKALKIGKAHRLVDNEETLMYRIEL